ncbi:unnamed protein product [Lactuca saligna]|uniref:LYR motif containing domain-containing protein n=1 Tax=Lactuca saligna TaxID=75948 RepID=A0AA35Y863_LACSI|nr:unnamed protein product [Lactuca saligna]
MTRRLLLHRIASTPPAELRSSDFNTRSNEIKKLTEKLTPFPCPGRSSPETSIDPRNVSLLPPLVLSRNFNTRPRYRFYQSSSSSFASPAPPSHTSGAIVAQQRSLQTFQQTLGGQMSKGLIWATADDLARNRGKVLSLYRQILRSLNSPDLPLNLAARLHRKAQARAIFMLAAEERSIHNIKDLFDIAEYSLSLLRKGEIPKYIQ